MIGFALEVDLSSQPLLFAVSLFVSALLMISRIPTYVLKDMRIPHLFIRPLLIMVAIFMAALFSIPWWTLSFGVFLYLLSIPLSGLSYRRKQSALVNVSRSKKVK